MSARSRRASTVAQVARNSSSGNKSPEGRETAKLITSLLHPPLGPAMEVSLRSSSPFQSTRPRAPAPRPPHPPPPPPPPPPKHAPGVKNVSGAQNPGPG